MWRRCCWLPLALDQTAVVMERTLRIRCRFSPSDCKLIFSMSTQAVFRDRKGNYSSASSVRSVQAAKPSSEVVVPEANSLVGARVSLDRLDHLLHKQHCEKFFCCFVSSVDSFLAVILPPRSYCCWFSSGRTISPPTSAGIPSGNARSSANAVAL